MPRTKLKLPHHFQFSTEMAIRVGDVNYAGHLSNDRVLAFIHEARVRFLKQHGFTELDIGGVGSIMTEAVILYKSEAFQGDKVQIHVTPADFHKYGCDFYYKLVHVGAGREIARAKTGFLFYDYGKRKMAPVPQVFIERCNNNQDAAQPHRKA